MNELDFTFEQSPWERFLMTKQMGDTISAAQLLTLLEDQPEQAVEDALLDLETGSMYLNIEDLPKVGAAGQAAVRLRQEMQAAKTGLKPEDFGPNDPLRLYLEELAQTPVYGDQDALAERCSRGDAKAMEQLTNLGLSRVVELAAQHVGYGVLLMDLIQEGSLGLWQAVSTYQGGDYAKRRDDRIRFAMAKAVTLQARASGVGQKLRTAMEDYRSIDERLLAELGRNPTREEMAQELHMGLEETAVLEQMLENARLLVKAQPQPEDLPQEEEDQAVEDTALFQMHQRIGALLSQLPQADAQLLTLRFGLEGGRPLSPEEVGAKLGIPAEQVVQREAQALAALRNS